MAYKAGGSQWQYLSCEVFRDWLIINIYMTVSLQFLKQNLTAFVYLVRRYGLEKMTFVNEIFLPCRVPTFRNHKVVKHGGREDISFLFFA